MKTLKLSPDQKEAMTDALDFLCHNPSQCGALTGGAGTGKTSILSMLIKHPDLADKSVEVMAPTGKAASVLSRKLGMPIVTTVHKAIYDPFEDEEGQVKFAYRGLDHNTDIAICDEASMLSRRMVKDLENARAKILYIGDPGQLPPVANESGYSALNQDILFHLDTIHRQAEGSSIISLATKIRTGKGTLPLRYENNDEVSIFHKAKIRKSLDDMIVSNDVILCGYNNTRLDLNERARRLYGRSGMITEGDWLCVQKNHKIRGVLNGERYRVIEVLENQAYREFSALVESEWGEEKKITFYLLSHHEEDEDLDRSHMRGKVDVHSPVVVDYGYALTVHKSQGSEWENVLVFDEPLRGQGKAWRYTAITRASNKLTYVR